MANANQSKGLTETPKPNEAKSADPSQTANNTESQTEPPAKDDPALNAEAQEDAKIEEAVSKLDAGKAPFLGEPDFPPHDETATKTLQESRPAFDPSPEIRALPGSSTPETTAFQGPATEKPTSGYASFRFDADTGKTTFLQLDNDLEAAKQTLDDQHDDGETSEFLYLVAVSHSINRLG